MKIDIVKYYAIIGVISLFKPNHYVSVYTMADLLNIERHVFGGCGIPSEWGNAIQQLVRDGVIEEKLDYKCRYRMKAQP